MERKLASPYHRYKVRNAVATTDLWTHCSSDTDRLLDPNPKGQTVGLFVLARYTPPRSPVKFHRVTNKPRPLDDRHPNRARPSLPRILTLELLLLENQPVELHKIPQRCLGPAERQIARGVGSLKPLAESPDRCFPFFRRFFGSCGELRRNGLLGPSAAIRGPPELPTTTPWTPRNPCKPDPDLS